VPSPTSAPGPERPRLAMKVVTVVGNRPQFVKAAAVSRHLRARVDEVLVHSGQHYDRHLSAIFFEELGLPRPDRQLGVGSGSHAVQTGATMARLEPVLQEEGPDAALVYGDTNTTLAAALVAAKLCLPLVHLEAGMRSFDRAMPEEVNRVIADRLADLLLCATETAMANLAAAGLAGRARLVGDPMADVALRLAPIAERESRIRGRVGVEAGDYLVATLHRAANVDEPANLERAVALLSAVAERHGPLVFPTHPRTRAALVRDGLLARLEAVPGALLVEPLGYLDFLCLLRGARAMLTDSGGVQKEAYLAGIPCLTLRERTEWVETLEDGRNRLVGLDLEAALDALAAGDDAAGGSPDARVYGGGGAGERCAAEIVAWLRATARS
jgi:UDP-GlcNAc3NAcA epimerase